MSGLYIHIPFCASRCIYCGFYSTTLLPLQDAYVEALCKEMKMQKPVDPVQTVYLGGGTPSLLSRGNLEKLFANIHAIYGRKTEESTVHHPESFREVTIECNPDDITDEFAREIVSLGINRVSIGAQTFSPARLRFIHRRHTAEQIPAAVHRLRNAGIHNISIDLMFGFPGETLADWEEDLHEALGLQVEHISAYSLMYEKGTPLYHLLKEGRIREIDDDLSLEMYKTLLDTLNDNGYEQYEISNFARLNQEAHSPSGQSTLRSGRKNPGPDHPAWDDRPETVSPYRSLHNSSYWHEIPYIGIGAAAHSYNLTSRQWNIADLHQYIHAIESGNIPCESERLSMDTRYDDLITTALRTREGIDLRKMKEEYGDGLYSFLLQNAEPHLKDKNMKIRDHQLSLTRQGLYISDDIMSDLMDV
ncbi:coproporphyrinogen III oxidase [Segatella asaccharophila]